MTYTFDKLKVGQRLTYYGYNGDGDEREYAAIVESIDKEADTLIIVIDDPEAKPTWGPGDFRIEFHRDEVDNAYDPLFGKPRRSNKLTLEPSYTYSLVFTHEGKEVVPGRMFVVETGQLTHPRFIVNFPTKRHWRGASRIEDIEAGLAALVEEVKARGIKSIAIPPLGCGLGGLDWHDVRPLIERAFASLPGVRTVVFEPNDAAPADRMAKTRDVPTMTPGRAVLVSLFERYLAGLLDPSISLLEVHKLMYFAQEAGEPLRLRYVKAPYGPYAENLRHVLATLEGYMISGYGDGGDNPDKALELVPGAAEDARAFLMDLPATQARFERVSRLVEGFESSFGMELLATVHWVMKHEGARGRDIVDAIHRWNPRKQMFTDPQIQIAAKRITDAGWLTGANV